MWVVIDTNVLISAFFWGGFPGQVLDAARRGHCSILTSETLLAELLEVLKREKFAEQLQQIGKTPEQFLQNYRALVEIVDAVPLSAPVSDDPDDDAVLACAISGNAEIIVSGDKDLLRLRSYAGIDILKPAQLLELLANSE